MDNYSPQENVDNDDGSRYYKTHDNFFVYGGRGMKNDFGGHDNHHTNNIYAYVGIALSTCSMLDGHEDVFYGNKVVLTMPYLLVTYVSSKVLNALNYIDVLCCSGGACRLASLVAEKWCCC